MAAVDPSTDKTDVTILEDTGTVTVNVDKETDNGVIALSAPSLVYSKDQQDPSASPGQCGLYNLGNTCFMNAGLHCLLNTTPLLKYITDQFIVDQPLCGSLVSNFCYLASKYWSGQFSIIHPCDFKNSLGNFHSQFQDYRQHDCQEFLALLLDTLHEETNQCQAVMVTESSRPQDSGDENKPSDQLNNSADSFVLQLESSIKSQDLDQLNNSSNPMMQQNTDILGVSVSEHLNNSFEQENTSRSPTTEQLNNSVEFKSYSDLHDNETINTQVKSPMKVDSVQKVCDLKCTKTQEVLFPVTDIFTTDEQSRSVGLDFVEGDILSPLKPLLNNASNFKQSLPSLEEFYSKESKTLNTNVLINSASGSLNIDSQKFAKQDNDSPMRLNEMNFLQDHVMMDVDKGVNDHPKGIKDVNIQADKCNKVSITACFDRDSSEKCNNLSMSSCFEHNTDSVKRMKFETTEKNLQYQAFTKLNRNISSVTGTCTSGDTCEKDLIPDSPASSRDTEVKQEEDTNSILALSESVGAQMLEEDDDDEEEDEEEDERLQEAAETAWESYIKQNNSIIVSTFQGMFKSMVICSECSNVSVTFEPFMYLSVPLPYSMERQICVWFMPCHGLPTKYLLTLIKSDKVISLKQQLKSKVSCVTQEMYAAEVLDGHVSKVLDDQQLLRFVNDSTRCVYIFQMSSPPECASSQDTDSGPHSSSEVTVSQTADVFSTMDSFNPVELPDTVSKEKDSGFVFDTSQVTEPQIPVTVEMVMSEGDINTEVDMAPRTDLSLTDENPYNLDDKVRVAGTAMWGAAEEEKDNIMISQEWNNISSNDGLQNEPMSTSGQDLNSSTTDSTAYQNTITTHNLGTDQWRTCAICLEELTDAELMAHQQCGGTFCQTCLEMSIRHYGEDSYTCPVCSAPAILTEDFISLGAEMSDQPVKVRIVAFPVAFCIDVATTGERRLIGHPRILYLPNQIEGQKLYEYLDKILPVISQYTVVMTDGQGLHCSRCPYNSKCQGCLVMREGDIFLRPGDSLTVCYGDLTEKQLEIAEEYHMDKSLELLRPDKPLQLYDCIQAFTDSEVLDEHNPWFCPRCEKNQCARKTMTVWQYPDRLIIHLKRFYYQDLSSSKVDSSVVFPVEGLDLTQIVSGPDAKGLQYDLYGIVCHFGGVNSGHYTAYAKNPLDQKWLYYNDESVILQEPQTSDFSNAYILFYQRQGSEVTFDHIDFLLKYKGEISGVVEVETQVSNASCLVTKDPDDLCKSICEQDVSGDVAVAS